jgi:hypothetical protein
MRTWLVTYYVYKTVEAETAEQAGEIAEAQAPMGFDDAEVASVDPQ